MIDRHANQAEATNVWPEFEPQNDQPEHEPGQPSDRSSAVRRIMLLQAGPWATSAVLHGVLLLILALWMMPLFVSGEVFLNAAFNTGVDFALDDIGLEHEFSVPLSSKVVDADDSQSQSNPTQIAVHDTLDELTEQMVTARVLDSLSGSRRAAASTGSDGVLQHASTIEGAVDRITGNIQGQLNNGDVLVVWLLDTSKSLVDDRQRVADRLKPFLQKVAAGRDADKARLRNAVVSFGSRMRERVAPTDFNGGIVRAVKNLPVDSTGQENVFAAVARCAINYRKVWKQNQLMFVIWTDESGDDVDKLERTIQVCRKHGVSVSVVGPSAVLGADTGTHAYTDPKSKLVYQLPVKRGPDTALPERLRLGYWFRAIRPRWSREWWLSPEPQAAAEPRRTGKPKRTPPSRSRFSLPAWYGGNHLKGLVSGFSPYALTRLTRETGGTYTIFDRPDDRGPFRLETMRKYLPEYGSVADYLKDIEAHPLRRAVHAAVKLTRSGMELGPPPLMLFGRYSPVAPHPWVWFYFTPSEFRSRLKSKRAALKREAARVARVVEKGLLQLSQDGQIANGLEAAYQQEESPRWKAWYDLTRGRLLATSVRLEEYRLACDQLIESGFLDDNSNNLIFLPSRVLKSSADFQARGEESLRLLLRCLQQNPNTPWAYLAQRELDNALGISIRQGSLKPTGAISNIKSPTLPKF